jgi:peptidoglycan/xylan/chitin deacetylase (PgdA/CDA1 family)
MVALDDVLAARRGERALPPRALLVTFDDGWKDSHDHALPILRQADTPFVTFLASDPVFDPAAAWWQEVLLWSLRRGRATFEELWNALPADGVACPGEEVPGRQLLLLMRYGTAQTGRREMILQSFTEKLRADYPDRHMLDMAGLSVLRQFRGAIGAHGASHLPLTRLANAEADLRRAADTLREELEITSPSSVSFPHGRYDAAVAGAARRAGYELLFTSDPVLASAIDGRLGSDLIGRIEIAAHDVADRDGRLIPERLATWLFLRPHVVESREQAHV